MTNPQIISFVGFFLFSIILFSSAELRGLESTLAKLVPLSDCSMPMVKALIFYSELFKSGGSRCWRKNRVYFLKSTTSGCGKTRSCFLGGRRPKLECRECVRYSNSLYWSFLALFKGAGFKLK
jgi:hypothetical protein